MTNSLDDKLRILKAAPGLAPPDLERRVWRDLDRLRESRKVVAALAPVRVAAVATALVFGLAGGGWTAATVAAEANETSVFSIESPLAPSTLLDGRE